jgi:hypothetical protein
MKAPNPKLQTPEPSGNQPALGSLFEIWNLEFGTWSFLP